MYGSQNSNPVFTNNIIPLNKKSKGSKKEPLLINESNLYYCFRIFKVSTSLLPLVKRIRYKPGAAEERFISVCCVPTTGTTVLINRPSSELIEIKLLPLAVAC